MMEVVLIIVLFFYVWAHAERIKKLETRIEEMENKQ